MSMQSLLSVSTSLSQMKVVQSSNQKMQGSINVLKAEIHQDNGNKQKEAKVEELQEQSSALMGDLMDGLEDVNGKLDPDNDKEDEKVPENGNGTEIPKDSDRVELSDEAKRNGSAEVAVSGKEEVYYRADGSGNKPAQAQKGKAVNVAV